MLYSTIVTLFSFPSPQSLIPSPHIPIPQTLEKVYAYTMHKKRKEMKTEVKEKMRGGEGKTELVHLVDCENEKNIRLLAELTLKPGCSIGGHAHENETEYFVILSGEGVADDNGTEKNVKAGDVVITGNGASHAIRNNGSVPLVLHAIIVTY